MSQVGRADQYQAVRTLTGQECHHQWSSGTCRARREQGNEGFALQCSAYHPSNTSRINLESEKQATVSDQRVNEVLNVVSMS